VKKEYLILMLILALSLGSFACGGATEASKEGGSKEAGKDTAKTGSSSGSKAASANPWGGFKVGSFVKMKNTVSTEVMGKAMDTSSETKMTLAELTSDKAVLDVEVTAMGNTSKSRTEIPLTATAPAGAPPAGAGPDAKTGSETITVAGKSLDCKTLEFETQTGGNKVSTKVWTSDQVPGFMVKSVASTSGAANTKTTTEVVDFKVD
jgi:hypothetical protein